MCARGGGGGGVYEWVNEWAGGHVHACVCVLCKATYTRSNLVDSFKSLKDHKINYTFFHKDVWGAALVSWYANSWYEAISTQSAGIGMFHDSTIPKKEKKIQPGIICKSTQEAKQEEQILKQSLFSTRTGLLISNLPEIFNHRESFGYFIYFTTDWLHKFLLFCKPMTLNESHGNSNWNQTVNFHHVLHQTKFETNQIVSIQMQTNV